MAITMHLCRGNYKSTFMGAGADAEAEVLFHRANVHGYFMEYTTANLHRRLRTAAARSPRSKIIEDCSGLVTARRPLAGPGRVERRIDEAAKFVPLEQFAGAARNAASPRPRRGNALR